MERRRVARRLVTVTAATVLAFSLAACDQLNIFGNNGNQTPSNTTSSSVAAPTATCDNYVFDSVFSAYGSVHYTRRLAPELTMYLDMFTEQKTHTWFPKTEKHLSFVLKIVDSRVPLRAKFETKRRVYMGNISIEAQTKKADGSDGSIAYSLDADPRRITLDPEALQDSSYGLLVTSPKGGFELDQIKLKSMSNDTVGFDMNFQFQLSSETRAGSDKYKTRIYDATIPVAVFTEATADSSTSCATSATLKPVG